MKKAKTSARLVLAAIFLLTVVLTVVGVTGIPAIGLKNWLPTTDADNWPEALPLGLDLRGGVYVEYSAARPDEGDTDFAYLLDTTMSVIRTRLGDKGYSEATVQSLGEDGIRVEIPDVTDTAMVLELIGEGRRSVTPQLFDDLLHKVACTAAVKGGDHEAPAAGEALIRELLLLPDVRHCPHGRPCVKVLSRKTLAKEFLRG